MGQGMNCHMFSPQQSRESGNIMIYILIAIVLFGGLTLVLSRQNQQAEGQSTTDEQIALQVQDMMTYSGVVGAAIDQIASLGTPYSSMVFINPASSNFETLTPMANVFHPKGGGINAPAYNPKIFSAATNPTPGWYIGRFNTVEGTPSTAQDIILTAHSITKPLCTALNKKLIGSATIPTMGANTAYYLVAGINHSLGNGTLTQAICPTCYDKASLCVSNVAGTQWSFYSIVGAQ